MDIIPSVLQRSGGVHVLQLVPDADGAAAHLTRPDGPGEPPGRDEAEKGWQQYFEIWRPGKPRREKWDKIYERAWDAVLGTVSA